MVIEEDDKNAVECCFAGVCLKCKKVNQEPFVWISEREEEVAEMIRKHFMGAAHNMSLEKLSELSPFDDFKIRSIKRTDYHNCVRYYQRSSLELYRYLQPYFEFLEECLPKSNEKSDKAKK